MTEPEAMRRAEIPVDRLALITAMVWVVAMGVTWWLTRGDYYRTFPSALWFWSTALAGAWTMSVYSLIDQGEPKLESVPLAELCLSEAGPLRPRDGEEPTLESVDARRHEVLGAYGAFLTDIMQIAEMPLLADPTCPATERFQELLVAAEDAHSDAVRDPGRLPEYLMAVVSLDRAWAHARSYAKRKGASTLGADEQDAVRRARGLLDVALDENAFGPERRAAMHKAVSLLRTVVDLPDQAVAAIDHRVRRLELEE